MAETAFPREYFTRSFFPVGYFSGADAVVSREQVGGNAVRQRPLREMPRRVVNDDDEVMLMVLRKFMEVIGG